MSQEPRTTFDHKRSAAPLVTTGGWVRGVYAHAIEYTTADKSVRGVYFLFGVLGAGGGALWGAWMGSEAINFTSYGFSLVSGERHLFSARSQ